MFEEDKDYLQAFSAVIPCTHISIEQYTSNCLSQTCSGKEKISTRKRCSTINSTFGNAAAILNKNYFISLLSSHHNLSY